MVIADTSLFNSLAATEALPSFLVLHVSNTLWAFAAVAMSHSGNSSWAFLEALAEVALTKISKLVRDCLVASEADFAQGRTSGSDLCSMCALCCWI